MRFIGDLQRRGSKELLMLRETQPSTNNTGKTDCIPALLSLLIKKES
jgi:hypothetical protein